MRDFPTPEEVNTAFRAKAKKEKDLADKVEAITKRVKARCLVRHANEVVEKVGAAIGQHVEKGRMTFQKGSHGEPNTIVLGKTLVHVILGEDNNKRGPTYFTDDDVGLEVMDLPTDEQLQVRTHSLFFRLAAELRDIDYWKDEVFPLVIDLLSEKQYFASASYMRRYDSDVIVNPDVEAVYFNNGIIDDPYLLVTMTIRVNATK